MTSSRSAGKRKQRGVTAVPRWVGRIASVLEDRALPLPPETWEGIRAHLRLSTREFEIALCAMDGRSRKQTAKLLRISPATVASYTERVYRKLGIASKGALATALFRAFREMESKEGA